MNKNEQKEYYDESMFNTLSDASLKTEMNDSPLNDLEYKFGMTTPESRVDFQDITRDMMLANLTEDELYVVRMKSSVIKDLQFIQKRNKLGDDSLVNLFRHDREIILVSSLSRLGYLRDNLISQIKKFKLDRQNEKGQKKNWKLGFGGNEQTE